MDDIENAIQRTVINLRQVQESRELQVKTVLKKDEFTETRIDRFPFTSHNFTVKSSVRPRSQVSNTICLSVEDIKNSKLEHDTHWSIFNCVFRKVLVYGKLVNLNSYMRDQKTCYRFTVDDGTEEVIATMQVNKEAKQAVSTRKMRLTTERNKLKAKAETGINIRGHFYPPDSQECLEIIRNISILHNKMRADIFNIRKDFNQGPVKEKALVLGNLYMCSGRVQLNILDLTLDDELELAWKRHLNKLYAREYLKKS